MTEFAKNEIIIEFLSIISFLQTFILEHKAKLKTLACDCYPGNNCLDLLLKFLIEEVC